MMPRLPTTDSIRELAVFWRRHDVTDFEEELEEVGAPVVQRAHIIGVPLTEDEHRTIHDAAVARGRDEGGLIHEWVKAKLRHAS